MLDQTHSLFSNSAYTYMYIKAKSVGALNESHQAKFKCRHLDS